MTETWNPADLGIPSRYGPADTIGAANEITAAKVVEAAALVREGRRYQLAQILDDESPAQMWRYWKHSLLTDHAFPERGFGVNGQTFLEETVAGALHSGTHLDGLAHIGIGTQTYNGHLFTDIIEAKGLTKLGIEGVPPLFSRGVLLDIARLEKVERLGETAVIGADQLERAAAAQGLEVRAGDIVLVHTGWGTLWGNDNERYAQSEPGLGLGAARWLTDRRVAVIGADNWAVESVPGNPEELAFPVHQHCIAQHGCYLLENVATAELAGDEVHEFCCVILPARLRGATASIVSPVAVV